MTYWKKLCVRTKDYMLHMQVQITYLVIFFIICLQNLQAQEIVDSVNIRAIYEFSYKTKEEQTIYSKFDLMYLDIGSKVTKFYSHYEYIRDSIGNNGLKRGLPPYEINELRRGYIRGTRTIYYNFLKNQQRIITSNWGFLYAYYNEPIFIPLWKFDNNTEEILGYNCRKASTYYLGREWIVYFTSEIPINQGPWKLWGLPGLIVKANDKKNFFQYELKGLENLEKRSPIIYVSKDYDEQSYIEMDKEAFRKLEKMYYENNREFMQKFLGIQNISISNPNGKKVEKSISLPYIPLEPW